MKRTLTLLTLTVLSFTALAQQQISNSGFENWDMNAGPSSQQVPDSFTSTDMYLYPVATITRSSDAHSGSYSAMLRNVDTLGGVKTAVLTYGGGTGFNIHFWPFTGRPSALKFWYKFSRQGVDTAHGGANFFKNGVQMGIGYWTAYPNASSGTQVTVPINYSQSGNPDTVTVSFGTWGGFGSFTADTRLWVDDISFEYTNDVYEPVQGNRVKFYPNPARGSFQVALPDAEIATLTVADVTGKLIYKADGVRERASIDCHTWPSGIYVVTVTTAGSSFTERLFLNQ